jgi:hypothetical protein
MELSEFVYRVVNDEALRSLVRADVNKAAASVGADLSQEELTALAAAAWDTAFSTATPQGPDQWWVRQLSRYPTPVRPSTPA